MENTKYFRSYHFPFSPGTTSDDRISKDYSFLENTEVVITEKLDGENNCITKGGVYARSHSTYTTSKWSKVVRDIHARIGHQLDDETFIFGEGMGAIHSLEYQELDSYYYVFGIRVGNEWLKWDDVCSYADILELPTVPVMERGEFSDIKTEVEKIVQQPSTYKGVDTISKREQMEGVVVRRVNGFPQEESHLNLLKWVRAGHVNTGEHWTKNWQPHKINGYY